MQVVILCGGSGTRLWPISRTLYPKQFCQLFGHESLFQKTILRNLALANSFSIVINQEQYFMGLDQYEELKTSQPCHFLLEPIGRNTAPAITLSALNVAPEEILLVVPSDHLIENQVSYEKAVRKAIELAEKNKLVTFGIKPSYPETGYGYIEASGFDVTSFKEKPDSDKAKSYIEAGNFFWNSGMFCFKASVFLNELNKHAPDIFRDCSKAFEMSRKDGPVRISLEDMKGIRSDSIDYAVMEKSDVVKVIPADIGWSDVGSFDSLYDALPKDEFGNTESQKAIHIGSKNNLIVGTKRLISTIDIEDLMIIDSSDALVISKKGSTQKIKDLVAEVKKISPEICHSHTTIHKPWGTSTLLEETEGYRVKKITVRPGAKLSLQYHLHRSEHWIVVSGSALITVGNSTQELHASQSIYIPKESQHRLANPGNKDLIIIEAQVGEYLGEDDVVRLQDDYVRN